METTTRGPVTSVERSLAPDLARGLALLGIALANSVLHISGRDLGPSSRPVDGSTADRVVDMLVGTFVDNRAFPTFTLLFAYGLVMILRRQAAHGTPWPAARTLLLRRCAWLAAFGAAHTLLLFEGDILLTYGLLGLGLVLLLVRSSDRALRVAAWASLAVYVGFGAFDGLATSADQATILFLDPTSFVGALAERAIVLVTLVLIAPVVVVAFLPPAVIGILLARRQALEHPTEHLPLLRRVTVGGFTVSILGSLPLVLASVGAWDPHRAAGAGVGMLHTLTGLAGAVAFACGVAWFVAAREASAVRRDATAPAPRGLLLALAAVGRRSLTCYLLQSVLFVPLLAPWAGGLGVGAGTASVAAVGVGVYLVTVVVALLLERAGSPGPAEALLRRLTYGSRTPALAS